MALRRSYAPARKIWRLCQAVTVDEEKISYSKLMPSVQLDSNGNEIPQKPDKLRMSGMDVYNVIKPYVSVRFMDQVNAVSLLPHI